MHDLNKIHDTVIPCECENYYSKFDFSGSTEIYLRCDIVSFTSWMRKGGDGEKETDFQTGKHTVERSPTNITRTARDVGTLWQLKIAVLRCVLYMCWGVGLNEIEKVYQWWWTSGDKVSTQKKIRDYLGNFPKRRTPPHPPLLGTPRSKWKILGDFVKNLVCFLGDFRVI